MVIGRLSRFILFVGPCSSVFDYATFFLLYVFGCWDADRAPLFQTGRFVGSLLTQTLIIHIIRTNGVPLGPALGFVPLPGLYWPFLLATLPGYVLLTQGVKTWLVRRGRV